MKYFAFLFVLTVVFTSCGSKGTTNLTQLDKEITGKLMESGDESFDEFYTKFLTDSAFQISRISFPLLGVPDAVDPNLISDTTYLWQQSDWVMNHPIDPKDKTLHQEFIITNFGLDDKVTVDPDYCIMRRFALSGDRKWYLIFYQGLNRCVTNR